MQGGSCLSRFKVALVILQKRAVKGVLHTEAAQAPVRPQGEGQLLLGATGQSLHRVIQEITQDSVDGKEGKGKSCGEAELYPHLRPCPPGLG